jgi:hypothetical protein
MRESSFHRTANNVSSFIANHRWRPREDAAVADLAIEHVTIVSRAPAEAINERDQIANIANEEVLNAKSPLRVLNRNGPERKADLSDCCNEQ